ncbi:MAG: hypothetical protein ACRC37_06715, partial [Lentisphaeria bacterium]
AYLANSEDKQCSLLFSEIMESAGYDFEALNALTILYRSNRDDLSLRLRLYNYHMKMRNYLKALEFRS